MSHIKFVMEINCGLLEPLLHSLMQLQSPFNNIILLVFDTLLEVKEMSVQNRAVYDTQGISLGFRH